MFVKELTFLGEVTPVQGLWRRDTKLRSIQGVMELEEGEAMYQIHVNDPAL